MYTAGKAFRVGFIATIYLCFEGLCHYYRLGSSIMPQGEPHGHYPATLSIIVTWGHQNSITALQDTLYCVHVRIYLNWSFVVLRTIFLKHKIYISSC